MPEKTTTITIDPAEIAHFATLSSHWWDAAGPFRSLHELNPTRVGYIRDHIQEHFGKKSLKDLKILDVGCGGGLLSEPLARLGAVVTGIDATEENIVVAKDHANEVDLKITYTHTTVESLKEKYDVVCALEIVEHVANLEAFVDACCQRVRPGGLIFLSTLNRTLKSYLLGIIAAEYILRWVPRGTHQWDKFVRPDELQKLLIENKCDMFNCSGLVYSPLFKEWNLSHRRDVNYICVAKKPAS
jgi:2-polyprenyl-6-hydroxyphenyl methylase/3-demethylubiquinone-9 3-methyltransferase